ncbi:CaiB/BaiF CoA transferase family protein [Nocardia vaccinii]|uniref:CaiB/BaiF CoA transferase family protein n=1 Tax=Nocardia vaccinii TaxID=1822 RepID=UPI001470E1E3|nr:CoA transferase [Nocardia vaccinii]
MSGPLAGLTVVDLAGLSGAYGSMLLAGLGADVIVVEPPGGGPLRFMPPFLPEVAPPDNSVWFTYLAQGKRSVVIDEFTDDGQSQLNALLSLADVVFDASVPDTRADVRAAHPGVVWVRITPFGANGPHRDWAGTNLTAWASSGALSIIGYPDAPPVVPAGPAQVAYQLAGLQATSATLMAMRVQRRSGTGQLIDIAVQECLLNVAAEAGFPVYLDDRISRRRDGVRRAVTRPYGLYPCSDGYVSITIMQPGHWTAMAQWIADTTGNDAFLDDTFRQMSVRAQFMDVVDEWTEKVTMAGDRQSLFHEGQRRRIAVTPLYSIADLVEDNHLRSVNYFSDAVGSSGRKYRRPGAPFRINHQWWELGRAPLLDEHRNDPDIAVAINQEVRP